MSSGIDLGLLCHSPEGGEISNSSLKGKAFNGKKGNPFAKILGTIEEAGTEKDVHVGRAEIAGPVDFDRKLSGEAEALSWNVFSIVPPLVMDEEESVTSVPLSSSGFDSGENSGEFLKSEDLPGKGEDVTAEEESIILVPQVPSELDSGSSSGNFLKSEDLPEKGKDVMAEEESIISVPQVPSELDSGSSSGNFLKLEDAPKKEGSEVPSSSSVVQDTAEENLAGASVAAEEVLSVAKNVRKEDALSSDDGGSFSPLDDSRENVKISETISVRGISPQDVVSHLRHEPSKIKGRTVLAGHAGTSFSLISAKGEDLGKGEAMEMVAEEDTQAHRLEEERSGSISPFQKEFFKDVSDGPGEAQREEETVIHQGELLASHNVSSAEGSAGKTSVPLLSTGSGALGEGIVNVVRVIRSDGEHRARIIVEPPALGRIEVELRTTSNGLEASLRVDNGQLKDLLQSQIGLLKSSLEEQGIALAGMEVDVRGDDDQRRKGQFFSSRRVRRRNSEGDSEETLSVARIDLERGLLSWTA